MNKISKIFIVCVGALSLVHLSPKFQAPVQAISLSDNAPTVKNAVAAKKNSEQLSADRVREIATSLTVKVFSGETWGSGIIIRKQGQTYTVITNNHVLLPGGGKSYRIQTPDGKTYPAYWQRSVSLGSNDLGLVQFSSANTYQVAVLASSSKQKIGDEVFAAGFPLEANQSLSRGFVFTSGQIALRMNKPFLGGYQLGSTNEIKSGMSGGPLINRRGEVIGINGMHKYPIWGNPYVFMDGSQPAAGIREQLIKSSWAVPIQTFLQLAPQFGSAMTVVTTSDPAEQQSINSPLFPIIPTNGELEAAPEQMSEPENNSYIGLPSTPTQTSIPNAVVPNTQLPQRRTDWLW